MIFWFTGQSGSGKSVIVKGLREFYPHFIMLDGNEMRHSISVGDGFSKEARRAHNMRVARLAAVLSKQGHIVLVSVIAPFEDVRQEIEKLCMPSWIYVKRDSLEKNEDRPYEPPEFPVLVVDTDLETEAESINNCKMVIDDIKLLQEE